MNILRIKIRIKYFFWKWYWRIFPPKKIKQWEEESFDCANSNGIAVGRIHPFGNPFTMPATKIKFDPVNYGVIAIRSNKE